MPWTTWSVGTHSTQSPPPSFGPRRASQRRKDAARVNITRRVAGWIERNSDPSRYEALNVTMEERKLKDVIEDAAFFERYPDAREYPLEMRLFDLIIADDQKLFGE